MSALRPGLFAFFALSASGCLIPEFDADCADAQGCAACLERDGCGWCAGEHACYAGTSHEPTRFSCRPRDWRFGSCEGPPPTRNDCNIRLSCEVCLDSDALDCVWCAAEGTCRPWQSQFRGDGSPVEDGRSCGEVGRSTVVRFSECPSTSTCAALDCTSCRQQQGCEWCEGMSGTGICAPYNTTCARQHAIYFYESCPPSNTGCPRQDDCRSCLGTTGCGWCETGQGTRGGYCTAVDTRTGTDYAAHCQGRLWFENQCPASGLP